MIAALALAAAAVLAPTTVAPAASTADCAAESGSFTWGFKESFRAYISGSIANGEWTTEGGIGYETPAFFSDSLAGSIALDPIDGSLGVDGALRFTGHDGILDTTISDVRFVVESPERLVVVVDIRGTTQDFVPVDSADVPFLTGDLAAAQWSAGGDALLIESIPLTLTAEGADAFGTYPEGEAFDALTLSLDTTAACATQAIEARTAGGAVPLIIAAGVIAAGVGIGAVLAVLLRRRRATMGA
ncbi:HtaA domain-containing protein [Microcella sp.]|uniref:HtaA domain-containing protein n=1 Tax=Microcella sp. TaxID=1913979 RepID=UPI003F6EF876